MFSLATRHFPTLIALLVSLPTMLCSSYTEIIPGLHYQQISLSNPVQSIYVLIADPALVKIDIGLADNKCASARTTTEIAKQHHAVAALNAGFFGYFGKCKLHEWMIALLDCFDSSNYKAFPLWTLKLNNHLYSLSHRYTGAIGWNSSEQQPLFSALKSTLLLSINGYDCVVNELNKPNINGPVLFSAGYDAKTPHAYASVTEVVITDNEVTAIHKASHGDTLIPDNGYVYVLPRGYTDFAEEISIGNSAFVTILHTQNPDLSSEMADERWNQIDNILSSTPLLIQNGVIVEAIKDRSAEFSTKRHPRSAVGLLENGNWVFVLVDGRQRHSKGFTIVELADFMLELGCTGALNLDGGGSSTMVINDTIVNSPSGREYGFTRNERPVSTAILISSKT